MTETIRFGTLLSIVIITAIGLAGQRSKDEKSPKKQIWICVPEFDNVSTRSLSLRPLRDSLVKALSKRNLASTASDDGADDPNRAVASTHQCDYVLKVQIEELYYQPRNPAGITLGSQRSPDVTEPESLNKRYAALLAYKILTVARHEEVLESSATGEGDSELQAAANAEMFIANRVASEFKKRTEMQKRR